MMRNEPMDVESRDGGIGPLEEEGEGDEMETIIIVDVGDDEAKHSDEI